MKNRLIKILLPIVLLPFSSCGNSSQDYSSLKPIKELFEKMNNDTRAIEKILTGMRTERGVELTDDVKKMLNFEWIKTHKDLVEIDKKYLHTTPQGLLILDDLILDLIK